MPIVEVKATKYRRCWSDPFTGTSARIYIAARYGIENFFVFISGDFIHLRTYGGNYITFYRVQGNFTAKYQLNGTPIRNQNQY